MRILLDECIDEGLRHSVEVAEEHSETAY